MNIGNVRLGITTLFLATGILFVVVANAEDAKTPAPVTSTDAASTDAGTADGDVDGDASDDASDDADANAKPPPAPAFDEKPFPEEKSPRPKKDDWKDAPLVSLSEGSLAAGGSCKFQRIREWMRIYCPSPTAQITLMCGNAEDVFLGLDPIPADWGTFPEGGEIVFAVHKGDRRLFEWQGVEFGYHGSNSVNSFLTISELWLPGEEKPVLIVQ
jgi:hypothetical protein